jgi:pimeloyl-ACP methyl ester carboxylesterase
MKLVNQTFSSKFFIFELKAPCSSCPPWNHSLLAVTQPNYSEHFYQSRDGLKLYYRDYAGGPDKLPVLCLHGLTRDSRDFDFLAQCIAPKRRLIVPDQRGRGRSQHDRHWYNYQPPVYIEDMWTLLQELKLSRVIVIGTSLGGLMGIAMASLRRSAIAGLILNDVGPELDPAGLERIRSYVGRLPQVHTWDEAAAQLREMFATAFPDFDAARWMQFARRTFAEDEQGMPKPSSDPAIGEAMRFIPIPPGVTQAMWFAFASLRNMPVLALRGERSDLLSFETFERMARELPALIRVTVPNRGHPPQLDEADCVNAVESFLARCE